MAGAIIFSESQLGELLDYAIKCSWSAIAPEGDGTSGSHKEPLQILVGACYLFVFQGRELEDSLANFASELAAAAAGSKKAQRLTKQKVGLEKEIAGARQKSKIMATILYGTIAMGLRRLDAITDLQYGLLTTYTPDPGDDAWGVELGGWSSGPKQLTSCEMV